MDPKTLIALRGSIAKWQAIVDGTGEDHGTANCPLCAMFYAGRDDCAGCPVRAHTGQPNCEDTPYMDYIEAVEQSDADRVARAELAFLTSLLPDAA